ncbi:MAG: hypothetical protein P8099_09055 [Gemmatimonadota bacterium]|jgi:hypothetical protein
MLSWLTDQPVVVGLGVVVLMLADWMLTVAQERERSLHYSEHYQSYPVDTIEGNPAFREAVAARRVINPRHLIAAMVVGAVVGLAMEITSASVHEPLIGYCWGLFLIVCSQHLSNLIGYRAARRGVYGKLWLHLRTGYITQAGRYFSLTLLLLVLAAASRSPFIYGVTLAGLTSSIRQLVWIRKVPADDAGDPRPAGA